jgi:hypothetical protein
LRWQYRCRGRLLKGVAWWGEHAAGRNLRSSWLATVQPARRPWPAAVCWFGVTVRDVAHARIMPERLARLSGGVEARGRAMSSPPSTARSPGRCATQWLRAPASCHPRNRRLKPTPDSRYRWMKYGSHVKPFEQAENSAMSPLLKFAIPFYSVVGSPARASANAEAARNVVGNQCHLDESRHGLDQENSGPTGT